MDPERLAGYRLWCSETKGLDDADLAPVWAMIADIRKRKLRNPIEAFFPTPEEDPCAS